MHVITRKVDESVVIGDDITVLIVAVHGKRVRLGVKVSDGVAIHRKEVYVALTPAEPEGENLESPLADSS